MTTYLVRFDSTPTLNSPDIGKSAGAYCTVWVVSESEEKARKTAVSWAERIGWQFKHWDHVFATTRDFWVDDREYLERFDRAQREGIAGIFESYDKHIAESN